MNKQDIISEILNYESKLRIYEIALNERRDADFVLGYSFDDNSGVYNVYINGERGLHHVRLSTTDEIEALIKLLKMVKYEAKLNSL